jgi:hypothetical protein
MAKRKRGREEVEPEKPGTPNNLQNPERRKAKKKP